MNRIDSTFKLAESSIERAKRVASSMLTDLPIYLIMLRFVKPKGQESMLVKAGGDAKKNDDYQITKKFLRKSQGQTKAGSELQPKIVCPAQAFGNARYLQ